MLQADGGSVRSAIATLDQAGELSAETFAFAGRAWRIAPSDVIKIQLHIDSSLGEAPRPRQRRKIVRTTEPGVAEDSPAD